MKKYRVAHDATADYYLPWMVEQFYPNAGADQLGMWCLIARFYRRDDARLFVRELREAQRPTHSELIPKCMKESTKTKVKGMWALALELAEADAYRTNHLPPTRPDKCYVRLADSDIVDYGETMADGRIQTGNHGIINQHDFMCWEWSTNLNVWKRIA